MTVTAICETSQVNERAHPPEEDMSLEAQQRRHKERLAKIAHAAEHPKPKHAQVPVSYDVPSLPYGVEKPKPPAPEPTETWVERQKVIHEAALKLPSRKSPSIEHIRRDVAQHFGITVQDLVSARRNRDITRPRQVTAYLCRILTPRSFPEIGSKLGGRDHTTILHAVRCIAKLIHTDKQLAASVVALIEQLGGMPE